MTVYVVNNLKIHDRAEYGVYVSGFMDGFARSAVAPGRLPREAAEGRKPDGAARRSATAPWTAQPRRSTGAALDSDELPV
ncbi:MAG TPA: hypothetical protein VFL14_06480 [Xanthomonadales bacterium]|nr:hypothetical protein [Xanthomonadales bacterium]